jgi:double-strand break repair protein MRE11
VHVADASTSWWSWSDILMQIQRAREDAEHLRQDLEAQEANINAEDEFDPDKRERKYTLQYPEQVLVRLKVEHSGFTTLNNQRFGSRFVGEVVS